jgi:calcium-dependent protein kinase
LLVLVYVSIHGVSCCALLLLLLLQVGVSIDEAELTELFMVADISGQGMIDYEEFIAAMLDSQRVAQRLDCVRSSFETLDRDGDGFISVQDLQQVSLGC